MKDIALNQSPRSKLTRYVPSWLVDTVKQGWLIFVQWFIGCSLLLDIVCYGLEAAETSHGVDVVALGPELSSPELFLDLRMCFEDDTSSQAFDDLGDILRWHGGNWLDEKVNMVRVNAYFDEMYLKSLFNAQTYLFQSFAYFLGEYVSAILGWAYDVVEEQWDVMALSYMAIIFLHLDSIAMFMTPEQAHGEKGWFYHRHVIFKHKDRVGF